MSSLRLLCPALIFSIFSWIFVSCVLIPAKREGKVLFVTVISALLNLILNIILIPRFAENAAVTTSLSEFISMLFDICFCKDIIKGIYSKKFWKNIAVYIVGSMAIILICIAGNYLFDSTLVIIAFDVIISVVEYVLILVGLKKTNAMRALDIVVMKLGG